VKLRSTRGDLLSGESAGVKLLTNTNGGKATSRGGGCVLIENKIDTDFKIWPQIREKRVGNLGKELRVFNGQAMFLTFRMRETKMV